MRTCACLTGCLVATLATADPSQVLGPEMPGVVEEITGQMVPDGDAFRSFAGMIHSLSTEQNDYQNALEIVCVQLNLTPDPTNPAAMVVPREDEIEWETCGPYTDAIISAYETLLANDRAADQEFLCKPGLLLAPPEIAAAVDHLEAVRTANADHQLRQVLRQMTKHYQLEFLRIIDGMKEGMHIYRTDKLVGWELARVDPEQMLQDFCANL